MAVTDAQLAALDAAIAAGRTLVQYGDKVVRYATIDEMLAARAALVGAARLAANPDAARPRHQLADFSDD